MKLSFVARRYGAVCLFLVALVNCPSAVGQYATSRFEINPLVVGGGRVMSFPGSTYAPAFNETDANVNQLSGFEGYADWYMNPRFSFEGKYKSMQTSPKSSGRLTERSAVVGFREEVPIGRVSPFIGLGFGQGWYSYTGSAGNQSEYPFVFSLSLGSEIRLSRALGFRTTYTFDRWLAQQNYHLVTGFSPLTYTTSRYPGQSSANIAIGFVYNFPLCRDRQSD